MKSGHGRWPAIYPVVTNSKRGTARLKSLEGIRDGRAMGRHVARIARSARSALALLMAAAMLAPEIALAQTPAKQVFGSMTTPTAGQPASHGFYSKGCLSGAVAMPVDGPTWQVMRLSRNRRWGHPTLIGMIEELSIKARRDGWNGLLVGDISQPRGGPMLTGHASHQIGLDADIWLTPMPDRRLSYREREEMSAVNVLRDGSVHVDDRRWNRSFERLLYHAAAFPQVERILVHPGVKKKLCDTVQGDRSWLSKIRPYYSHNYHFHIRIGCQPGSPGCRPQQPAGNETGCDSSLQWWFDVGLRPAKPSKNDKKPAPAKPKVVTVADLPQECSIVVDASGKPADKAVYRAASLSGFAAPEIDIPKADPLAALSSKPIEAAGTPVTAAASSSVLAAPVPAGRIPVPTPRPADR